MKSLIRIFAAALVVAIVLISVFVVYFRKSEAFVDQIKKCNDLTTELRFSCYRYAIEKNFKGRLEEFSQTIKQRENFDFEQDIEKKSKDITYAIFGTNCHSFYHAAGDFVATYATPNTSTLDMLKLGTNKCTSGYMMGVFKRTALKNNYSTEVLKDFLKACGDYGTHQCSHEIGHILHDKYTYSILKVLDSTTEKEYGYKYPEKYSYVSNQTNDLNAPFQDCREIVPDEELQYCYTGIGHNLFLFAEFAPDGFKDVFKECDNVKQENRESCFAYIIYRYGQNVAGTKMLSGKTDEAKKICEDVINLSGFPDTRKHCFIGIGGGIGLYADTELGSYKPTKEDTLKARKFMHKFIDMCKELDEGDINNCIAGLFGTPFRKLYQKYLIEDERVDSILENLDEDFQVVG